MTNDHPHAHGMDEVFQCQNVFQLNVDLARRLIASGQIATLEYSMPVKDAGCKLLGLPESLFGAAAVSGDYHLAAEVLEAMNARVFVDTDRLSSLSPDAMELPALMVMWNLQGAAATSARMRRAKSGETSDHSFPVLCDGNHRLAKAFLDGREEPLPCLIVRPWDDIERFLSYLGKPVIKPVRAKAEPDAPMPRTGR